MASEERGASRRGHGLWKDERRSPGYLPQGRRKPFAILALIVVGLLARFVIRDLMTRTELALFVILIGLSSFWVAAKMDQRRLEDERYSRGPGWFIGWLISKTSVPFARGFYILLGVAIWLLGVVALLT
jgi:uncharacterized membrane protein YhaH (DUF805 family)